MSALFVNDVRRNHELPARIRRCRELLDVGGILSVRRREAGPIPASSHRVRRWFHRTTNGRIRSRVVLVAKFLPAFLPVDVPAGIILFELFSICQGIMLMIVTNLLLLSI
jgi:hypothetical protein